MTTDFEQQWAKAEGTAGLRFWYGWLASDVAATAFDTLNNDDHFPWNQKPRLYGQRLPQHAYVYDRRKSAAAKKKHVGLQALDDISQKIEQEFHCQVSTVYCNRFQDPAHCIEWHQDQYGSHIFVLSLGRGTRLLEFENLSTHKVTQYQPQAGDLYFMSLQHNKEHRHRVVALNDTGSSGSAATTTTSGGEDQTRLSFVFFATPPGNLPEYKLTLKDRTKGALNWFMS